MEIQINYDHNKEKLKQLPLEELAGFVLGYNNIPENAEVSINFVNNDTIAELNKKYRGQEGPTDVLSFECDGSDDAPASSAQSGELIFLLGDVVIAPDVAKRQTEEFGTAFEEEIGLLLVHGLLHLCGYDHIKDEEAEVMENLEAEILKAWAARQ